MNKIIITLMILSFILGKEDILDKIKFKIDQERLFLNFKNQHKKIYKSEQEQIYKFSVFKDNQQKIDKLNRENLNVTFESNQFSDITQDEFLAIYATAKPPTQNNTDYGRKLESEQYEFDRNLQADYPSSLDLMKKYSQETGGFELVIRNQGSCGSCWAFSAIAPIEFSNWKRRKVLSINLSEQQLVDCVYPATYDGCNGGWMRAAYDYLLNSQDRQLFWEINYGYIAKSNGFCKLPYTIGMSLSPLVQTKLKSYSYIAPDDDSIKSALVKFGILAACVDATNLSFYQNGIFFDSRFSNCHHSINIVGYGTENGIPYYIVRNSWGTNWGEKGYIRMDARRNPNGDPISGLYLKPGHIFSVEVETEYL